MKKELLSRREAERKERMQTIIAAAKTVFVNQGYFKTSVRGIAQEARLSPGVIYYYFTGVDEIYVNICEESFQLINEALQKGVREGKSALEKLERMALNFLDNSLKYPEYTDLFVFSNIGWRRVGLDGKLVERLERTLSNTLSIVYEVVEEGKKRGEIRTDEDSWRLVHALWVAIEGAICLERRGLLENAGFDLHQLLATQLKIISGGIRPRI